MNVLIGVVILFLSVGMAVRLDNRGVSLPAPAWYTWGMVTGQIATLIIML